MKTSSKLKIRVTRGRVLGVKVYRGYAPLSELSLISKADVYDQKSNPTGTQRDLSPKHAREAYEYVRDKKLAYWPEVFLCVRNADVVVFKADHADDPDCGVLLIDKRAIKRSSKIAISRVDGNHRLHFADGHDSAFPPLKQMVSFCLAADLKLEDEIALFRDINNNQKRMNTSHLDNIEIRLTEEQMLMQKNPELYIAQKLGRSSDSPLKGMVYEGGKKSAGKIIPLRNLKTGIEYMLSRPSKLTALKDAEAQYKVIRNYFLAVKEWVPKAWEFPADFIVLRGAGLWGMCFLGAEVIGRVLSKGAFESSEMHRILVSGKKWDWSSKGSFQGYSGRGGALKISELIAEEFVDSGAVSVKELYKKIMG